MREKKTPERPASNTSNQEQKTNWKRFAIMALGGIAVSAGFTDFGPFVYHVLDNASRNTAAYQMLHGQKVTCRYDGKRFYTTNETDSGWSIASQTNGNTAKIAENIFAHNHLKPDQLGANMRIEVPISCNGELFVMPHQKYITPQKVAQP